MKRYSILIIFLLLFISVQSYSSRVKIAKVCYVNTKVLLTAHPASRSIIKEIREIRKKYQNEINTLETQVKDLENKIKKQATNLTQSEIRTLLTQLEAKKEALNYRISKRNGELREIQVKKLKPAYKRILSDIRRYAKSLGYNIVIDSRYVLIGARDLDLTQRLKRIFLNKK